MCVKSRAILYDMNMHEADGAFTIYLKYYIIEIIMTTEYF